MPRPTHSNAGARQRWATLGPDPARDCRQNVCPYANPRYLRHLATLFDHPGAIYRAKFEHNLSQLNRTKLSGFLVGDAWGEGPLLAGEQKSRLRKRAGKQVGTSHTVLASVAGCGVAEARE